MNEDTRIAVCCYEGDGHQVKEALHAYQHHSCPVVVLSPDDSRVVVDGVDNCFGGKRAYTGQLSLDRQAEHLRLLLTFPENHFLIHDADSFVLDPKIPDYLYAEPDIVWTNQVNDGIPEHQPFFPAGWPHVAFQPPYFLSRSTIERMLAIKDSPMCVASPCMPFIDFYMVQLTITAGLPWKRFLDGLSFPISIGKNAAHPGRISPALYDHGFKLALNAVENEGANILHSIKDHNVVDIMIAARQRFNAKQPGAAPRFSPPPDIGRGSRRGPKA